MANTTVINPSAVAQPRAPATPVEPLANDVARLYTHLHPVLVLSLYAFKFRDIVADPVPALLSTLLPLGVLQIAYVAVCLPPTGGTSQLKKHTPGKVESGVNGTIVVG
jgi:phosphatidylinositol glycan class F